MLSEAYFKEVGIMMNKYTLYARRGYLLCSNVHFLVIGDWIPYHPDIVILEHGMLTDGELAQLRTQLYVNVYQHTGLHTVSITVPYDSKYLSRQPDYTKLLQYIGHLTRQTKDLYTGRLNVK